MIALAVLLVAASPPRAPIVSAAPLPARITRVVSASPAITEIVCAIGGCQRLVGVTRFCDEPAQVQSLPKIGGFVDPSIEATVALRPDLVLLTTNGANQGFTAALDKQRIAWRAFRDETLGDFAIIATALGDALALQTAARDAVVRFERDLEQLSARPKLGKAVLVVYGHAPLIVAGPGTFGAELLEQIGARNAYRGGQRYPTIDLETLVSLRPDLIVDVEMLGAGRADPAYYDPVRTLLDKAGTRLVFAPDPALLRLGPRLPRAMLTLQRGLGGAP